MRVKFPSLVPRKQSAPKKPLGRFSRWLLGRKLSPRSLNQLRKMAKGRKRSVFSDRQLEVHEKPNGELHVYHEFPIDAKPGKPGRIEREFLQSYDSEGNLLRRGANRSYDPNTGRKKK